jgi:hypothetical protein
MIDWVCGSQERRGKAARALVLHLLLCMTLSRSFLLGRMSILLLFHHGRCRQLKSHPRQRPLPYRIRDRLTYHICIVWEEALAVEHLLN